MRAAQITPVNANLADRPVAAPVPARFPHVPGHRIVRRLGQGGMATVYLAVQESLDRQVAIKVMAPIADEAHAQRFEHEARTIGKLEHPSIVNIHEVGRTEEGLLYYVMPYLSRGDLSHRVLSDDEPRILSILRALLDALSYAHARGIVHRDVKAENVLFDSSDRPLLADFGIALSKRSAARLTTAGMTLGSGGYMAPEQARGDEVDHRVDLYSVGVLAFELLTGELPYQAEEPLALAMMHAHDPVPRLPREKRHWQPFIDRAMAKAPEKRFKNARLMLRALDPVERRVRGGTVTLSELAYAITHDPAWRKPWALTAMGVLLAAGVTWTVLPVLDESARAAVDDSRPPLDQPLAIGDQVLAHALANAEEQFAARAVLEPAGANAAETWLGVLRMEPANPTARAGLVRTMGWIGQETRNALAAGNEELLRSHYARAELLRDSAGGVLDGAFIDYRSNLRRALEEDVREAVVQKQQGRLRSSSALLTSLGLLTQDELHAVQMARIPEPHTRQARRSPAARASPPQVQLATITRSEFAEFADATGREPARCHLLLSPLRLINPRDWRDFGKPADPVVCISYDDAQAYARWRSRRDGASFRLPSGPAEAVPAASGIGVWTHACADAALPGMGEGACPRRVAAGTGEGTRPVAPDRGYDQVGLLLIREG
jgi:serine/threonine protein kinase